MNGPGQSSTLHYPQKFRLGTNDVAITIGMEKTACLEVLVLDDKGNPLQDAKVSTWPNVRYGEWAATILTGDCYNSADRLQDERKSSAWWQPVPDFQGTSDSAGLAVIFNLPAEVGAFSVEHPRFALPAVASALGDKRRQATMTLSAGRTNRVAVQLEPRNQSPITHY